MAATLACVSVASLPLASSGGLRFWGIYSFVCLSLVHLYINPSGFKFVDDGPHSGPSICFLRISGCTQTHCDIHLPPVGSLCGLCTCGPVVRNLVPLAHTTLLHALHLALFALAGFLCMDGHLGHIALSLMVVLQPPMTNRACGI